MTAAVIYMESELEEGDKPNTPPKTRGAASKNIKTKSQAPAAKNLELMLTDAEEPTPEKSGRGLRRTYAQNFDAEYNSVSEREGTVFEGDDGDYKMELSDNEETPKKKSKPKPSVREAIKANRTEPAGKNKVGHVPLLSRFGDSENQH
jgi:hypothetical protein